MSPATDWKETIPPDEAERFEAHAKALRALQHGRAKNGKTHRALHAKGQAGLEASFTVLPDLPSETQVGLFAKPASYRAYVRFSNGGPVVASDRKPDVRGIAIKVLGVAGKKIIPGMESAPTQDFLLIKDSTTPFRNADEFVHFVRAAANPALLLPRAFWNLGVGRTFQVFKRLLPGLKVPTVSLATTRYFSALPIRFGSYAVRYQLQPRTPADPNGAVGASADYLGEELAARLAKGPVEYDFRVQFFVSEDKTPIEDSSRDWSEADAPYITVARLTLLQQDVSSPRGQKLRQLVEELSFDPWHALEEFRPLGNMMRARNYAYRQSTEERSAKGEPDGSETL